MSTTTTTAIGVETPAVPKPQPQDDPPAVELDTIDPTRRKFALFSGGDDSLVATHYVMSRGWADCVVYLKTNSGLAWNVDFVRWMCDRHGWPLVVVESPMELVTFAQRYGFPGATDHAHGWAYRYFKGRQLREIATTIEAEPLFYTGVYPAESGRRRVNIDGRAERETTDTGDFKGWWISPLVGKGSEWVESYRDEHGLVRNPVADAIHRSGDCFCMAYGHRDEVLVDLASTFPQHYHWLMNVERRVQEYRGRLLLVQDDHPGVYEQMNEVRKWGSPPYPTQMETLRDHFSDVFDWVMAADRGDAIHRGALEEENYLGHGGMSSAELQELIAKNDQYQMRLCSDGCW